MSLSRYGEKLLVTAIQLACGYVTEGPDSFFTLGTLITSTRAPT